MDGDNNNNNNNNNNNGQEQQSVEPPKEPNNDNMDFDTRLQEALNKHLEDLNNKIDAIGLENKKLKQEKRSLEVTEELNRRNLDASLYDVVFDNDPEITNSKINIIDEVFKKTINTRVQQEVDKRLKASSYIPPSNSSGLKMNSFEDIIRKG